MKRKGHHRFVSKQAPFLVSWDVSSDSRLEPQCEFDDRMYALPIHWRDHFTCYAFSTAIFGEALILCPTFTIIFLWRSHRFMCLVVTRPVHHLVVFYHHVLVRPSWIWSVFTQNMGETVIWLIFLLGKTSLLRKEGTMYGPHPRLGWGVLDQACLVPVGYSRVPSVLNFIHHGCKVDRGIPYTQNVQRQLGYTIQFAEIETLGA